MKSIILTLFIVLSGLANGQSQFEKGMQKAFEFWKSDKADDALNLFERIANAEKDNWLPHYYIAQINSLKSWNVKDGAVLKSQLDKAQEHLDMAMMLSENNPELLVMQAQVLTNWIAYDGRTYGMKYAGKVTELYEKAHSIAPDNPRVAVCKADWAMGSAKYFGQDTAPFCKQVEAALALFDTYEPESKLHPNWGKKRGEDIVKSCKQ